MNLNEEIRKSNGIARNTLRLRLTALYGGLFLISGSVLLAITYVMNAHLSQVSVRVGINKSAALPFPSPSALIEYVHSLAQEQHAAELHHLLLDSIGALGLMSVFSIALGWLVAGRVLRPIRFISSTARDISATNLHRRLNLTGPNDELKELGDTFDNLLCRLETSFQSQRQFVANASHELRTPLTLERALIESALTDPEADIDSYRVTFRQLLAANEDQERLIESLLMLARSERGLETWENVNLAQVAREVLARCETRIKQRGINLSTSLAEVFVSGNQYLLERMIGNLVDNAVQYNIGDGEIRISATSRNDSTVFRIENTGPLLDESAARKMLEPFQRLGQDRTAHGEGLGLGLSIVSAIGHAHHAQVHVEPREKGGLEVELVFPPPRRKTIKENPLTTRVSGLRQVSRA